MADAESGAGLFRPSDEDIRAYLDGEYGPPSAEAVRIIQDELEHAARVFPPGGGPVSARPRWAPVDDGTASVLDLIADVKSPVGRDVPALFLAACEADARAHDGIVSVNRVRERLAREDIPPRRYSALWAHYTGHGKPMVKTGDWETCKGSASGNDGRPYPERRWVGGGR